MSPNPEYSPKAAGGFTLLETTLSIAVFLILVTAAFSLFGTTTELMSEISEVQNSSVSRLRLVESVRIAFEKMTSTSSLEFDYFDRGNQRIDTYLSLVSAPGAFDFGLKGDQFDRVVLAAEIQPDGFIRSGIYYFSPVTWADTEENNFVETEAPYVELHPRMTQFSWRFYDARAEEWKDTLDGNFQHSLVELTIRMEGDNTPLRSVFWHCQP